MLGGVSDITVLHVDDSTEFLAVGERLLPGVEPRIEVVPADSIPEAEAALSDREIDCIVCDYDLGRTDGIDFLRSVRESDAHLPFILLTGRGSEGVASEAISAGVTDYITKGTGTEPWEVLAHSVVNAVERRRAEQRAARSQSHLRALTAHTSDVVVTVDEGGRIDYVNHAVESTFGYEPTAIEGEPLARLLPDCSSSRPELDVPFEMNPRLLDGGNVELDGVTAEDDAVPVSASFTEFTVEGETYFAGILRDVSHRDALRRKVRETTELYEALVEQSLVGIVLLSEDGIRYANPTLVEMLGHTRESIRDTSPLSHVHEDDRSRVSRVFAAQFAGERTTARAELGLVHREGHRVDVRLHATAVDYDGDPAIIAAVVDITDQLDRERRLRESERRYRTLAENFPNGAVALYDHDLRYTVVSGTVFGDLDLDAADLEGEHVTDAHSESFLADVEEHYRAALTGESRTFEFSYADRRFAGHAVPVREADGSVAGGLAMTQDITRAYDHRRELEAKTARLEEVAEVASQDLREPLQSIRRTLDSVDPSAPVDIDGARRNLAHIERVAADLESVAADRWDGGVTGVDAAASDDIEEGGSSQGAGEPPRGE